MPKSTVLGSFNIDLNGSTKFVKSLYNIENNTVSGLNETTLNNLVFPNNIETISGSYASDDITSIHFGSNIKSVTSSFSNLTNLNLVTIESQSVYDSLETDDFGLMTNIENSGFVFPILTSLE